VTVTTNIATLAQTFIHKIAQDNRIRLSPFDRTRWLKGAYSTMQRTLRDGYEPLSPEQKSKLEKWLFAEVLCDRAHSLDNLESIIGSIASQYRISAGHSQKLVGMLSKYAYAATCVSLPDLPLDIKAYVDRNLMLLPVPIDNYVLGALLADHRPDFPDIIDRGLGFRLRDSTGDFPWSRMIQSSTWRSMQARIQAIAKSRLQSPLEFEMRSLWVEPRWTAKPRS
jgi:hypothetical protein